MDGLLLIDKPAGITSHDVVAFVRRTLNERRIGHTGTLDPFATGLLVLLIGRATRLAQFLNDSVKEYEALIRLGAATDTGDITGKLISAPGKDVIKRIDGPEAQLATALEKFRGEIIQIPPMYSAKKIKGRKLYESARRGETVDRKPIRIHVYTFEIGQCGTRSFIQNNDGTIDIPVHVVCSAGTYVRTLAEDFAGQLGTTGHLAALRRTRAGEFLVNDAITLERLKESPEKSRLHKLIHAPDTALPSMPFLHLSSRDAQRVLNGMAISPAAGPRENWIEGERVRMRDPDGNLIAVGYYDASNRMLHPRVVLATKNSD